MVSPLPLPELCRGVWEAEVGSSGELVAFSGGFDDAACGCHGGEAFVEGGGAHRQNGAQIGEWLRLGGVGEGWRMPRGRRWSAARRLTVV